MLLPQVICVAGGVPVPALPSGTSAIPGATPPATATLAKSVAISASLTIPITSATPPPSPSASAAADDEDDDDLPWCDEL